MIELTTPEGTYKLGFTRNVIKRMEKDGFDFKAIQNAEKNPLTSSIMLEELFENAFKTYNPKITSEEIANVLSHFTKEDRQEIAAAITAQFNNALTILSAMMGDDDEGTAKNGSWKVI